MSVFSSVPPGADLPMHARDLVRMHEAVIGGGRPRVPPRPLVSRSWSRALSLGLAADGVNARDSVPLDEVARRRRASPLRHVVESLGQVLGATSDTANMLLVVTDADGIILWRAGSPAVKRRADTLGFTEGAEWTESRVGTNAIGTALAEAAPVELLAGEHFEQGQHPWYCTASPVHDPRTGELLGVIDVSGPALTLHPAIAALVETGRRLAESELWRHHQQGLDKLRKTAEPVVAGVGGPALLVDDDGWVAHAAGIAPGERIAAPEEGRILAVPGLGACLPERLAEGWLVRPADTARRVRLDLELGHAPMLRMRSGDVGWVRTVTPRHAEILVHLHAAGPSGLSAEALSRALYGDAEHLVTVRAEVSRLRRLLGAIVDTRPYRLASGVGLTVHKGLEVGG
ncbi:GAF domain-containing protein [Amycolatopsis sp. BJA-103]|uniref:GAF domain-containing protein n=1 Tax=Amycolatopsis sp. BJA-103 TaxID=1911175 RepID=UPI000C764C64|nr:helix-turn-helix domain-containing protein [Amycolatopsis sp. BJA-103]AUI59711.1 diguanylate cyclase [Amycolatopsis sp. BJA-103]PNE14576.1 diguanylate cyclase [Amycolatopsis sp. BJA-103]